jgi:hypothetical protein
MRMNPHLPPGHLAFHNDLAGKHKLPIAAKIDIGFDASSKFNLKYCYKRGMHKQKQFLIRVQDSI